jgi:hypothetical protein
MTFGTSLELPMDKTGKQTDKTSTKSKVLIHERSTIEKSPSIHGLSGQAKGLHQIPGNTVPANGSGFRQAGNSGASHSPVG